MHSCIYEGIVAHRRYVPVKHQFQYRLYMLYLDLEELPELLGPGKLISNRRFSIGSFLEQDHVTETQNLVDTIQKFVHDQAGVKPMGRIRLLTQLRHFGYYFSPLNLFYLSDRSDQTIEHIVAEVNNTPWKQRHWYILSDQNRTCRHRLQFVHRKEMHVSPFMEMEMDYHWRLNQPGSKLNIRIDNQQQGRRIFTACMSLQRRELSRRRLFLMAGRYPWMTAQIIAGIHFQALQLWWKKCPVYPNPQKHLALAPAPKHHPMN